MARRAASALAALLAFTAVTLPAALSATAAPASASVLQPASRRAGQPVSIAITGMSPQQAKPGSTITVTGTLTNLTRQQVSHLAVQLLAGSGPVTSVSELQPATAEADGLATTQVAHASWLMSGQLQPSTTVSWSIRVKASAIGMTSFGAYPLAAQAQSSPVPVPLATAVSYLPYVPARKGPYGSTIPARTKISWVWPLIDQPLLNQPWQNNCAGPQAALLAASLASTGRLGQLVQAGAGDPGSAETFSAVTGRSSAATARTVRSQASQNLAGRDNITWAVDPALLANVRALAGCTSAQPRWARAARSWLADLSQASSGQPLFVTPYADPNVSSLINAGHAADVRESFTLGRAIGSRILKRVISPAPGTSVSAAQTQTAGIAWPADGISGYATAENLAADSARTLLLSSAELPQERASVLQALNSLGGYLTLMLANSSLTQVLASPGSRPSTAFATSQEFLAETALLATLNPGQPIVVAPPRRWAPAAGLPADVLADTAAASWLTPVSMASLTDARHIPTVPNALLSTASSNHQRLSRAERRALTQVNRQISELEALRAAPSPEPYLALATIESSATSRADALALLRSLSQAITRQERSVQIVSELRITLGGLKGSVPVSIDNRLGYPVRVRVALQYSHANAVRIAVDPGGLITVAPHTAFPVRLKVQAAKVGSTTVALTLENSAAQPLPVVSKPMTIQATQVGVLGMIICAAALGVALIAYAARAARGGRRGRAADPPASPGTGPAAGEAGDGSATDAGPDTVVAERTGLGAAGTPRS